MVGSIKKVGYNNMISTDFPTFTLLTDLVIGDGDNGEVSSYLNRESVSHERYDGAYHITSMYKWSERFSPKITFVKDDFSDFQSDETESVLSWLTSKSTPSFADFYTDVDGEGIEYSVLGGWTDIQINKISSGRVIGITAVFEGCHPYALSPIQTASRIITTPQTFVINCGTNDESFIYPKIIVTYGDSVVVQADHAMTNLAEYVNGTVYQYENTYYWIDDGNIQQSQISAPDEWATTSVLIENLTTATQTKVCGSAVGEIVTIDGANRVISSSLTQRIFGNDFSWIWMPITRGDNTIKITGNCTVELQWREVKKIAEW